MGSFLKKLVLLLIPVLLATGWLELRLRQAPSYYNVKRACLEQALPGLRVLVLGSSQANQGIKAQELDPKAFNLAHVGQDHYYDRRLAETLLPRLPDLKLVVLVASYISLEYSLPNAPEDWRTFCYGLEYGIANEVFRYNFDPRQYSQLALTGPYDALGQAVAGFKLPPTGVQADGFQSVEPVPEEEIDFLINGLTAQKRLRYQHGIMRQANAPLNVENLKLLAGLLKNHGVALALVVMPLCRAYSEMLDDRKWQDVQLVIGDLTREYGAFYFGSSP